MSEMYQLNSTDDGIEFQFKQVLEKIDCDYLFRFPAGIAKSFPRLLRNEDRGWRVVADGYENAQIIFSTTCEYALGVYYLGSIIVHGHIPKPYSTDEMVGLEWNVRASVSDMEFKELVDYYTVVSDA